MNLSPFEHQFIRTYQSTFGSNSYQKFLIAVSGGADSMACVLLFKQFQLMFKYDFRVAHIHHGLSGSKESVDYRFKALDFVKNFCEHNNLEFITNLAGDNSVEDFDFEDKSYQNEQALRDYRYTYFHKWLQPGEILVLGHHLEDMLETQVMDLIRGSHFHHWKNLTAYTKGKFRPLCHTKKHELEDYLQAKKQNFVPDPSNEDLSVTRNWLRHKFFKTLNDRFPGALENIYKNLNKVYEYEASPENPSDKGFSPTYEIPLTEWMLFTYSQKQKFVLQSHLGLSGKSLTQGQIEEIIRQLDQRRNDLTFQTGPIFWVKNTEKIYTKKN